MSAIIAKLHLAVFTSSSRRLLKSRGGEEKENVDRRHHQVMINCKRITKYMVVLVETCWIGSRMVVCWKVHQNSCMCIHLHWHVCILVFDSLWLNIPLGPVISSSSSGVSMCLLNGGAKQGLSVISTTLNLISVCYIDLTQLSIKLVAGDRKGGDKAKIA
jgi:hypothetical protein